MRNENGRRLSWREIRMQREPDFEQRQKEKEHIQKLEEAGCLPKALSSVLGVPMTREQEIFRLAQAEDRNDVLLVAMDAKGRGEVVDVSKIINQTAEKVRRNALEFVQFVNSQPDTPAGKSLQRYEFGFQTLNQDDIRNAVKEGKFVVLSDVVHAAHVVPDEDSDLFISLNDDGVKLRLPDRKIKAFVFKKK